MYTPTGYFIFVFSLSEQLQLRDVLECLHSIQEPGNVFVNNLCEVVEQQQAHTFYKLQLVKSFENCGFF